MRPPYAGLANLFASQALGLPLIHSTASISVEKSSMGGARLLTDDTNCPNFSPAFRAGCADYVNDQAGR
jgi:hypothetical protein